MRTSLTERQEARRPSVRSHAAAQKCVHAIERDGSLTSHTCPRGWIHFACDQNGSWKALCEDRAELADVFQCARSLRVHACACIHVCMHTCVHTYAHVQARTRPVSPPVASLDSQSARLPAPPPPRLNPAIHSCVRVRVRVRVCVCVHIHPHSCMHPSVHVCHVLAHRAC